ncbi:MAG: phage minor head protein, partial [Roseiarcus sp.]
DPLDEEDDQRLSLRIGAVLDGFDLDLPAAERDDLESVLAGVAADSAELGYAQVGVGDVGDDLFEQLNEAALAWAKQHAAELVSQISDTTRDDVRSAIADGIASNLSTAEIADAIADLGAFSDARALLIAETEIATANSQGALAGYKQASADGVEVMKEWLVAADDVCDDCQDNADAGPIDLDEDFPSGDDAPPGHPHCRCALSPVVRDAASEEDGTDKMVKRGRFVCA